MVSPMNKVSGLASADLTEYLNNKRNLESLLLVLNVNKFPRLSGETTDSPRIQRAINSLGSSGGAIFYPKGTYLISEAVTSGSYVRHIGESRFTSIWKAVTGLNDWMLKIVGGPGTATSKNHWGVEYLTANGDQKTGALGFLYTDWTYEGTIHACEAYNFNNNNVKCFYIGNGFNIKVTSTRGAGSLATQKGYGFYVTSDVDNSPVSKGENVTQIKFDDCLAQYNDIGFVFDLKTGGSSLQVMNSGMGRNVTVGALVQGTTTNVTFDNNHFELQPIGISAITPSGSIRITQNDFFDVDIALRCDAVEGVHIDQNRFNGTGSGLTVLKTVSACSRVLYGENKVFTNSYSTVFDLISTRVDYLLETTQVVTNNPSNLQLSTGATRVFFRNTSDSLIGNILGATDGQEVTFFFEDTFTKIIPNATILMSRGQAGNGASVSLRYNATTNRWNEFSRRNSSSSSIPVSGNFSPGIIVENSNAAPGGRIGWVCTSVGPLVFKGFGQIDP